MAFVAGQLQDVRQAGRHALRRIVGHAQRLGDLVGRLEPDAGDVPLQAIGIGLDQRDRLCAVLLVDLGRQARRDAVALQPDQRGPGRLLALPGLGDGLRAGCADAGDLPQPLGRVVEHVRRGRAEVRDDPPRDGRADAGDQPAAEIALQAGQAGDRRRPHLGDLELPAVARVLHPVAEQLHSLAGREERHHADDSHGRGAVRLELGHRVAGLVVAVGQRADRAAQRLRHATGLGPAHAAAARAAA